MYIFCGMVRDAVPCNEDHYKRVGWGMFSGDGTLHGNGKYNGDLAGHIEPGQVLTMQVDMDAGILKFWLDGKPHRPGYTSEVAGPLCCAATLAYTGNTAGAAAMGTVGITRGRRLLMKACEKVYPREA